MFREAYSNVKRYFRERSVRPGPFEVFNAMDQVIFRTRGRILELVDLNRASQEIPPLDHDARSFPPGKITRRFLENWSDTGLLERRTEEQMDQRGGVNEISDAEQAMIDGELAEVQRFYDSLKNISETQKQAIMKAAREQVAMIKFGKGLEDISPEEAAFLDNIPVNFENPIVGTVRPELVFYRRKRFPHNRGNRPELNPHFTFAHNVM